MIYLDYNATAPLKSSIAAAMASLAGTPLNPSSIHHFGQKALHMIQCARKSLLHSVAADRTYRCIFTGSGTEANNMVVQGYPQHALFVSAIEHPCILEPAQLCGASIIPVDQQGLLKLDALESALQRHTAQPNAAPPLVSVMLANNETGVIEPIKEIAAIVHRYHGILHTDAVQAFGKIPIEIQSLGADIMTLSSHKIGGPQGAAALIVKKGNEPTPLLIGGGQEERLRAGTHNVPAIMGFGMAAEEAELEAKNTSSVRALRDQSQAAIEDYFPNAMVFSKQAPRLDNTLCVALPTIDQQRSLIAMDMAGIAISAGAACSSGKLGPSHVMKALEVPDDIANTTLRFSLGRQTTEEEIQQTCHALRALSH